MFKITSIKLPKMYLAGLISGLSLLSCQPNSLLSQHKPSVKTISDSGSPAKQSDTNVVQKLKGIHTSISKPEYRKQYQQDYLKNFESQRLSVNNSAFSIKSTSITPFVEDFSTAGANFGDGSNNGWTDWGSDYYRDPAGSDNVTVYNPQNQSEVLPTGFYKTIPLSGQAGDSIIAKMKVKTTFTANSDTTLVLYFNDSAQTVAVTDTARGNLAGDQTLFVETTIPQGATQVTIAPLVYLAANEQSSLLIDEISLEQIPAGHYVKTTLLDEPLDSKGSNSYGSNSPLGIDEEFAYDFYVVDNWPQKYAGDGAVTVWNPGIGNHTSPEGGLVKRINLSNVQPGDSLTGYLYTAPTFSDANSFAVMSMQFFNANDTMIESKVTSFARGNNYRWQILDRVPIPNGASYVKLVPTVKLAPNETSSLLWDSLRLYHYRNSQSTSYPSSAEIGPNGGTVELLGVAKLVIPAGALTETTLISLEKLNFTPPPIKNYSTKQSEPQEDKYASEVVKISPIGLSLQKPAELFLEPKAEVLGNNHSAIAHVYTALDVAGEPQWSAATMLIPPPGEVSWPNNLPAIIDKLSYAARFMPYFVSPQAGNQPFILNHSPAGEFSTQQYNPYGDPPPYVGDYLDYTRFISFRESTIPFSFQKDNHNYLDEVYNYYDGLMTSAEQNSQPPITTHHRPKGSYPYKYKVDITDILGNILGSTYVEIQVKLIPVYYKIDQDPYPQGTGFTDLVYDFAENPTGSGLELQKGAAKLLINVLPNDNSQGILDWINITAAETTAHELWHAFQFSNFIPTDKSPFLLQQWILEGPAEYMGAAVPYIIPYKGLNMGLNANIPPHYRNQIVNNQADMSVPIYDRSDGAGELNPRGYSTAAFFTYLANASGIEGGNKIIAKLASFYQDTQNHLLTPAVNAIETVSERTFPELYFEFVHKTFTGSMYESFTYHRYKPNPPQPEIPHIILDTSNRVITSMTGQTYEVPKIVTYSVPQNYSTRYFRIVLPETSSPKFRRYGISFRFESSNDFDIKGYLFDNSSTPHILNPIKDSLLSSGEVSGEVLYFPNSGNSPLTVDIAIANISRFPIQSGGNTFDLKILHSCQEWNEDYERFFDCYNEDDINP